MSEMVGRTITKVEVYDLNVGMMIHYEDGGHSEIVCGIHEEGDERLGCLTVSTDDDGRASCRGHDVSGASDSSFLKYGITDEEGERLYGNLWRVKKVVIVDGGVYDSLANV